MTTQWGGTPLDEGGGCRAVENLQRSPCRQAAAHRGKQGIEIDRLLEKLHGKMGCSVRLFTRKCSDDEYREARTLELLVE